MYLQIPIFRCLALALSISSGIAQAQSVIYSDEFERLDGPLPPQYWYEGNGHARIADARLLVDAITPGTSTSVTVWLNRVFAGDVRISFQAHVLASVGGVNNINFFMFFSDYSQKSLFDTRTEREDGRYGRYGCPPRLSESLCARRELNGYILTYVAEGRDMAARFRLRDAPGFHLLQEARTYENRANQTYSIEIVKRGARIDYLVDGKVRLTHVDQTGNPVHSSGIIGFRTWNTKLWFDNLVVESLK